MMPFKWLILAGGLAIAASWDLAGGAATSSSITAGSAEIVAADSRR